MPQPLNVRGRKNKSLKRELMIQKAQEGMKSYQEQLIAHKIL